MAPEDASESSTSSDGSEPWDASADAATADVADEVVGDVGTADVPGEDALDAPPAVCVPSGAEICNGIDDDCDDVIDEGCPGALSWVAGNDCTLLGRSNGDDSQTHGRKPRRSPDRTAGRRKRQLIFNSGRGMRPSRSSLPSTNKLTKIFMLSRCVP